MNTAARARGQLLACAGEASGEGRRPARPAQEIGQIGETRHSRECGNASGAIVLGNSGCAHAQCRGDPAAEGEFRVQHDYLLGWRLVRVVSSLYKFAHFKILGHSLKS